MVSLKTESGVALARARVISSEAGGLEVFGEVILAELPDFLDEDREGPGVVAKVVHLLRLFDLGAVEERKPALVSFIVVPAISKFLNLMTNDSEDAAAADELLVVGLP